MRILFALPGLHRYDRGAEVAFISVANELAKLGETVTLIGSGRERPGAPYRFLHASSLARKYFESFPSIPPLRNEFVYEELTFVPGLLGHYRPSDYDVTLTCSYPFVNWILRRPVLRGRRPPHVFITQNGDWPAVTRSGEYRFFGCEGLVCINPDYYERNKGRWNCALIPNGVDVNRFRPGEGHRKEFGIPADRLVVLMVSALDANKRVVMGVEAVSRIPNAHLVVAGDGRLRQAIDESAAKLMPGRFTRLTIPAAKMPDLYRSADVFLHLAKDESFGNVYLEAMACGLPVVAHDSPRLRWIVGDDEFLLDTTDPDAIARHIEIARERGRAGQQERVKKVERFSWPKIGAMYQSFLQDVVRACGS